MVMTGRGKDSGPRNFPISIIPSFDHSLNTDVPSFSCEWEKLPSLKGIGKTYW